MVKNSKPTALIVCAAVVIVAIFFIFSFYNNGTQASDSKSVLALADGSVEASNLNSLVTNQNKFVDCVDEIVNAYKQRGMSVPSSFTNISKNCKENLDKGVISKDSENFIVTYTISFPEGCGPLQSSNTLNVSVNIRTGQTLATWKGKDPAQQLTFSKINRLAASPDCESYAENMLNP